ncbi:hypothetical protein HPP92_005256 [Vanilla planifolia]|uniref:Membrane-associated kinase regulator 2 n=1 Tax=Vanilla planifolia TaxID=51239 RepID=A0A835VC05_VANPL|nr:hypothetical protein HPP92_005256 [Vanilla planifolia]
MPNMRTATNISLLNEDDDGSDGEGPFFDLELTVANGNHILDCPGVVNDESEHGDVGKGLDFTTNPSEVSKLLSDDEFFFAGVYCESRPWLPFPFVKEPKKFHVFSFGIRKTKSMPALPNAAAGAEFSPKPSKLFVMETVAEGAEAASPATEEKKESNSIEVLQKCLRKIKPLYIKVSKRYAEKQMIISAGLQRGTSEKEAYAEHVSSNERGEREKPAMQEKLRLVHKRFGKGNSSSSSVVVVSSPQRHDYPRLPEEDGIQSAIEHCKRSLAAASKGNGSVFPAFAEVSDRQVKR